MTRFDELLGGIIDGDLSAEEMAELATLVGEHPAYAEQLQHQLEAAEMIALAEDELRHPALFTAALEARVGELDADDPFVSRLRSDVRHGPRWRRPYTWLPWGVAAATIIGAVALWASFGQATAEAKIVELVEVQGQVRWTGDGGQIDAAPKAGQKITGGTLDSLSPDAWATLKFPDATSVTIGGLSSLTISAPRDLTARIRNAVAAKTTKKILYLRRGTLSASVPAQPSGQLVSMSTPTATLEAQGTQFRVAADATATQLTVSDGRVQFARASDGRSVDVPAAHSAVASVDVNDTMDVVPAAAPTYTWIANIKDEANFGEWIDGTAAIKRRIAMALETGRLKPEDVRTRLERLMADPNLAGSLKAVAKSSDSGALYVCALTLARIQAAPVVLAEGSRFRILGRVAQPSALEIGLGVGTLGSGPKARLRSSAVPVDGNFDVTIALADFQTRGGAVDGLELFTWFALTRNKDAGLEIRSVKLMGPEK